MWLLWKKFFNCIQFKNSHKKDSSFKKVVILKLNHLLIYLVLLVTICFFIHCLFNDCLFILCLFVYLLFAICTKLPQSGLIFLRSCCLQNLFKTLVSMDGPLMCQICPSNDFDNSISHSFTIQYEFLIIKKQWIKLKFHKSLWYLNFVSNIKVIYEIWYLNFVSQDSVNI